MELRQLRSFIAVAEELHFQRAARRINLSQPALSQQIKALEEEVGVTLIERDRRSVTITSAGEAFLSRAREAVSAADAAIREAQEAAGMETQSLSFGYASFMNLRVISRSISAYRREVPNVKVNQLEMPTAEVYPALKEREIDIGFGMLPVTHPTLKFRAVASGFWSVVVCDSNPLFGKAADGELPLSELAGEPIVMFDRSLNPPLFDSWIERYCEAGFEPQIVMETSQVQTGLDMARDCDAAFVVASYIVDPVPQGLYLLKLTGFENDIQIAAAWHEDNKSAALQDYLRHLRAAISN